MASSNSAQSLIDEAEKYFKSHNPEESLRLAIMAKQLNPLFNADGTHVDRFIAAYEVHIAAATQKNSTGDVNWYAVLGIVDDSAGADIETIKKSYKKLAILVHPDKNTSVAAEGAFKLILKAWDVLSKAYDIPDIPRSSSSSHGAATTNTYGGRLCPTCNQWCNYKTENCFIIYCSRCCRKYLFQYSSPSSSFEGGGASGSSSANAANSHAVPSSSSGAAATGGSATREVCPYCNTHCVFQMDLQDQFQMYGM